MVASPQTAVGTPPAKSVIVVGAGIVGVSCALYLQRDGHRVTLVDRDEPGSGTSFGNAGGVVSTSCTPLATPRNLKAVPSMLFDPLGPLVVRWRYLPKLLPWLIRFLRESAPDRVEHNSRAIAALGAGSLDAWYDLLRSTRSEDLIKPLGWLKVYETEAGFAAAAFEREMMDRRGHRYEILNADELRQLEPALAPIYRHGYHQPDCAFIVNPKRAVDSLAAAFAAGGGRIERAEVTGFELNGAARQVVTTAGPLETDAIVLACGAWSRGLARELGAAVPLETERGYHLMLPQPARSLNRPTNNGEHSFVLTPMEHGIRLASQVELAGLDAPPDYRRVRALLPQVKRMLPSLETTEQSVWLGFRPTLPDSKPVLGASPRHRGVYFAFGHNHLGLTHGPVTGRIVADLVAGRDPGLDMAPYRADR